MDVAMDSYLAVPLLFTVLAIVLASVFVRLRRGEGQRAAEPDREGEAAAAVPEDKGGRVPVEEVGAGEEGKEAAGEQRGAVAEPSSAAEPSPAAPESIPRDVPAESIPRDLPAESIPRDLPAESIPRDLPAESIPREPPAESIPRDPPAESIRRDPPADSIPRDPPADSIPRGPPAESINRGLLAESIPRQAPAEPREPEQRDDVESKIPPLGSSPGSSLGHVEQEEDGCGHAALSSKAEEEDLDSDNEKLEVREPEDEDAADEMFSFKYSPGKLRGNQYKSMMTKEELEEEQRTEDYMKLSLASS